MIPTTTGSAPYLLLADDDVAFCQAMSWALQNRGFRVTVSHGVDQALQCLERGLPDYAVIDLKMPGKSGLTLLPKFKELKADMRILVLTGYASIATAVEAMKLGATHYLAKPVDADDVLQAFNKTSGDSNLLTGENTLSAADFEWEHLQKVLTANHGNISATARQLNIDRRTLQRKLARRRPA